MLILSKHVLGENENKVWEKSKGLQGVILEIVSHFLLLRDQATWKRRFKENKVRKQNPNFIFCNFDFGGKSLT